MKNENRENLRAMCGRGRDERRVGLRNRCATPGRPIKKKNSAGVLWPKETERVFEEGPGEIRRARGSVAGNGAHKQGRVGAAHCGCRKRRDPVRAERRQVFRAGFEHEAVHHRAGFGKTGAGVPLPHDAGDARHDFE